MGTKVKITGVKKAVGEYKRCNSGGYYDPHYGRMMLDRDAGEVWVDEFYSLGHNSWMEYDDPAVINLVSEMCDRNEGGFDVSMESVKAAAEMLCKEWRDKNG